METHITLKKSEHYFFSIMMLLTCLFFSLKSFGQTFDFPFGKNATTILNESWVNENWQNSSKITNNFDSNKYLIHSLYQEWDATSGLWVDKGRADYINNPDGTVQQGIFQTLTNGTWENTLKMTYTYNGASKVSTAITEIYYLGSLIPTLKQTFTYDGNGYLTNSLTQTIGLDGSTLTNNSQTNYTNLGNGKVDFLINQTWNTNLVPPAWVNSLRTTFEYDLSGKVINTLNQNWIVSANDWKDESRNNFAYNPQGDPSVIITQTWNDAMAMFVNSSRVTFGYEQLGVDDFGKAKAFAVYPVPAYDKIMVKMVNYIEDSTFSISDETGRLFLRGKLNSEETSIDVSQLAAGVYFCEIDKYKGQAVKILKR